MDECATGPRGPCGPGAHCQNLEGGYRCSCPEKYQARGTPEMGCERAAVDIDCAGDFDCTSNAQCLNGTCQCRLGYQISGVECVDVDECAGSGRLQQVAVKAFTRLQAAANLSSLAASLCGPEAECRNTDGSYRCECRAGYEKLEAGSATGRCRDVDECGRSQPCGPNSSCFNTEGAFKCACNDGFVPADPADSSKGCRSPCEGVSCGPHAACKPHGEEAACVCKPGFTFDPNNVKLGCVDIDECDPNYGPSGLCGQRALCTNLPGSYRCHCPAGFTGDAYRYCEDVNECDRKFGVFGQCGELAVCTNKPGSFACACAPGYAGDPKVKCVDIDECSPRLGPSGKCGLNALCSNAPGRFTCRCPAGFAGDPHHKCLPERPACSTSRDCPTNQLCQAGRCHCPFGQPLDSPTECRHPCDKTDCGPHATCQLDGESQPLCVCEAGFMAPADGRSAGCVDINECIQGLSLTGITPLAGAAAIALGPTSLAPSNSTGGGHPCGRNALCRNQPGSFDCVCPPGHTGNAYQACTLDVRSQQAPPPPTTTTTTTSTASTATGSSFGNYQQEPRTTACAEPCARGLVCSDGQCVQPDTCRADSDCLPTMACEHANQALGFQCLSVCELGRCGPEARCSAQNHKPICACNATAGFAGDPYDLVNGCRPLARPTATTSAQPGPSQTTRFDQSPTGPGDISTVSLDYAGAGAGQQQPNGSLSDWRTPTYELPIPTTPILPHFEQIGQQQGPSSPAPLGTGGKRKQTGERQESVQQVEGGQKVGFEQRTEPVQQPTSQTASLEEEAESLNRTASGHRQVVCTTDQHCPGNLLCLAGSEAGQRLCGCPANFRREADFCFLQRVNCTSAANCKAREDCIRLRPYYATLIQQQQLTTISQQFSLAGGPDDLLPADQTSGICICPRGYRLTASGLACLDRNECDEGATCPVGAVCQNKIGSYECVCPPGTLGDPYTRSCEPVSGRPPQADCQSNSDCGLERECDLLSRKCVSPCRVCGPRATCTVANHTAICLCPPRYTGNAIDLVYGCQESSAGPQTSTIQPAPSSAPTTPPARASPPPTTAVGVPITTMLPSTTTLAPAVVESTTPELVEFRTIPPSELFVMCLADGIQVEVQLGGFDGIIYVKGHSQDPKCRKLVMSSSASEFVDFKVQFGHCDLIHRDGEAGFVLVIQKHPKLVTYRARAYHVKCVYNTGERTVTLGFNVSMITTSGTIANTGPPPTCLMSITALDGREVTSAEIGQDLLLRVDVQPDSIYGGFARSCEAKTMDDEGEYQYEVTDANGCATDPSIFSDWKYDQNRKSLVARFNAFKFPSSNNLRFQCNIRVCFGSCPAVNCNGVDAYGRRRRRRREAPPTVGKLNGSMSAADEDETATDELIVSDAFKEGALREEIMVQSNAILTFDRKEASLAQQQRPPVEEIEFVCLPRLGIVLSLALTTLLGLLALAIATTCWCFSKRRHQGHQKEGGPLPHPMDFPNPLLRSSSASTLRESIYGP